MMIVMKHVEAQENEYPGDCKMYWLEVPHMRARDRADAVRRLGKAGKEGSFLAFPEKYLEQIIEMERAQITKEVVREKQAELEVPE